MINIIILRLKILFSCLRNRSTFNLGLLGRKNIFIFLGADYGNLGDVAITYAQMKYLKEHYQDYNVVEIPISQTVAGINSVKRVISNDDIVVLIGGGNTSDLYDDIEWLRQLVILYFRKYKIIGFPQTFDFSNSIKGRFCKFTAHHIYQRAKYLTILAREQNTMNILRRDMKDISAVMAPDIVMTLDECKPSERKGVLICMRSDKEKAVSDKDRQSLVTMLQKKYGSVTFQDTQVNGINKDNRYYKLSEIINNVRSHELVITDRLHGMILCFITGTPALVFDNSNHKISACFDWIKDCGYIKMIGDVENIEQFIPKDNFKLTHNKILQYYNDLICLKFH